MFKEIPTIELVLGPTDEIELMSLVKNPAIEETFVYFNSEDKSLPIMFADEEQHIITGPALIPGKLIYRIHPVTGEEFNLVMSADTIKQIAAQFIASHTTDVNLEHAVLLNDIQLIEMWTVLDSLKDKSVALGMVEQTPGTLMLSYKVNNAAVWAKIKSGEIRGFSIEGRLSMIMDDSIAKQLESKQSSNEPTEDEILAKAAEFIKQINKELESL